MDTPSKPLPRVNALLSDTWKLFTSTWSSSIKASALLLISPALALVLNQVVRLASLGLVAKIIFVLIEGVIFLWAFIRVMLTMLNLEAQKQPGSTAEESQKALHLILPLCWVMFLVFLVVAGGTILLIIPGIYFGTALTFSTLVLIDQGKRGTQALAASRALVKGLWWEALGYSLVGSIVFGFPVSLLSNVVAYLCLFLVAKVSQSIVAVNIVSFFSYLVIVAFFPLLIGYQVKLYRAFQRTR